MRLMSAASGRTEHGRGGNGLTTRVLAAKPGSGRPQR